MPQISRSTAATVPARALVPLRVFLGAAFLYAGFDKLVTPSFFDATSAVSIQAQMAAFVRFSPIGGLVRFGLPFAVPIGLAIALAEIAIGLGALSGLAFRLSAIGGVVLSLLFFLTASWNTRPFYEGPDLPYAAGWLVLALAGHGGVLVHRSVLEAETRPGAPTSAARRELLQAAVLGAGALIAASIAVPLRFGRIAAGDGAADGSPSPTQPTPSPAATIPPGAIAVATVADVQRRGSKSFLVPFDAPAPLPAGDPAIIVQLADGTFVAYDAVCTHAGCTVGWDRTASILLCPCHGAAFDAAHEAAVLDGPTDQPLAALPIFVDAASGSILLRV